MNKLFSTAALLLAVALGFFIKNSMYSVPETPTLDPERWWGEGTKPEKEDVSIRPFKIEFNNTMIEDLRQRLRNRRPFTKPLDGIQSQYGINTIYLEKQMKYWLDKYDFKAREEKLNQFPHYKTRIQGLDLHFVRVKPESKDKQVLPLLMLHGWPSSSKEFLKVIPILTTPRDDYDFVFEVIAADLPGFGYSQGTNKPGLTPPQISVIMKNLMKRLGHERFFVQAGDWGSQVATHMATLYPDDILGFHSNMPLSSMPKSFLKIIIGSLFPSFFDHADRIYPLKNYFAYLIRESGYFHLQATKPDTIGLALTDSPVALAGYIMEKLGMASDRNQLDTEHGGLDNLDIDDVLDTLTIMWANNCQVTATRIYAEATSPAWPEVKILHSIPTPVPTAALNFKHEVMYQPDWVLRDKFTNLVRSYTPDFGGHIAGLQTPAVLAEDIFEATAAFLEFYRKKGKKIEL